MSTSTYNQEMYPSNCDVLFGRGKGIENHPGNIKYRTLISSLADEYDAADKKHKNHVAAKVQNEIHTLQGRFLSLQGNAYVIETDKNITDKIKQAFRDRMKNIKKRSIDNKSEEQIRHNRSFPDLMNTLTESVRNIFVHLMRCSSDTDSSRHTSQDSLRLVSMALSLKSISSQESNNQMTQSFSGRQIKAPARWIEMEKRGIEQSENKKNIFQWNQSLEGIDTDAGTTTSIDANESKKRARISYMHPPRQSFV